MTICILRLALRGEVMLCRPFLALRSLCSTEVSVACSPRQFLPETPDTALLSMLLTGDGTYALEGHLHQPEQLSCVLVSAYYVQRTLHGLDG